MRFSINISKGCSALYSNSPVRIIYENGFHSGEIDHQAVIAERPPTYVMAAGANRRYKTICASKMDRGNHISNARTASNHTGAFTYARIPDLTSLGVPCIRRLKNLTLKCGPEGFEVDGGHGVETNCTPTFGRDCLFWRGAIRAKAQACSPLLTRSG